MKKLLLLIAILLSVPSFASAVNITQLNYSIYIHGTPGWSTSAINFTDDQIRNAGTTGWTCDSSGIHCNFSIALDSDNFTSVSNYFDVTNFTNVKVYYNASDGTWRNASELALIGQGNMTVDNWSSLRKKVNYTLGSGDGYDYGIRDVLPGGSFWLNETGGMLGRGSDAGFIRLANDFISARDFNQLAYSPYSFSIYNSSGVEIYSLEFLRSAGSASTKVQVDGNILANNYNGYQTVYFFDWNSNTWKIWMYSASNTTHGVPNWNDPRFKEEFKWRYAFARATYPSINFTFLMTAHDPFVRIFVDAINGTVNSGQHNLTIPISLSSTKTLQTVNQNKPAEYFTTSGGASEQVLWSTQNFKNNTHSYNLSLSSIQFNHSYKFNSTLNNNFLFSLGTSAQVSTTSFDPTVAQLGFSNETLESVANSTLTYYDLKDPSLVGYWRFENESLGYATDYSGWNNTGTLTNMNNTGNSTSGPTNDGKFGKAMQFDGVNDYVSIADSSNWYFGTKDFTIDFWVRFNSLPSSGNYFTILFQPNTDADTTSSTGIWLYNNTGTYEFEIGSNTNGINNFDEYCISSPNIATNTWYHIAFVRSGVTNLYCFQDGVSLSIDSGFGDPVVGPAPDLSGHLLIGNDQVGDYSDLFLDGSLDELHIWKNRALSADEILAYYQATSDNYPSATKVDKGSGIVQHTFTESFKYDGGAAGIWRFDEGSGSNVTDSSGNGNTGYVNGPTWITNSSCKYGSCLSFDGSNDYVSFPNTIEAATSNNLQTFEGWVYNYGSSAWSIFGSNADSTGKFHLYVYGGNTSVTFYPSYYGGTSNDGPDTVSQTVSVGWHHIAVVKTAAKKFDVYFDGTKIINQANREATLASNFNLGRSYATAYWPGTIDEFRIYPRALTDTEIKEHYQSQVSKYYDDFGTAAGKFYRYFGVEDSSTNLQPITPANTVLHLRFNDNSTVNVTDYSGYGNNGRTVAASWFTNSSCKNNFGGCMNFDGTTNDYITMVNSATLNISRQYTIVAWVNTRNTTGPTEIIRKPSGSYTNYYLLIENSKFEVCHTNVTNWNCTSGTTTPIAGQWYYVVGVFNGTHQIIYVNGSLENAQARNGLPDMNGGSVTVGLTPNSNRPWNGIIDEVLVINRSLTSDEVKQLYLGGYNRTIGSNAHRVSSYDGLSSASFNLTDHDSSTQQDYDQRQLLITGDLPQLLISANQAKYKRGDTANIVIGENANSYGNILASLYFPNSTVLPLTVTNQSNSLVGFWKFDEGSGTSVSDSSGNGNNGTVIGANWTTGKYGNALNFSPTTTTSPSASNTYVNVGNRSALNPTNELTMTAWVYIKSDPWGALVISKTNAIYGFDLGYDNSDAGNGLYPEIWDTESNCFDFDSGTVLLNNWQFLAVTWKTGGNMTGYINGTQVAQIPASTLPIGSNILPVTIGRASWGSYGVNGTIDEVRIYNRSLSAAEISQIYQNEYVNFYNANYQFKTNDPEGNYTTNVTDDFLTNTTNSLFNVTAKIIVTLNSNRTNSANQIVMRPNTGILMYGTSYYDSDGSAFASNPIYFNYSTTSLGSNTTDSNGNYNFSFSIPYSGNYTLIAGINDAYNNSLYNTTLLYITSTPFNVKYRLSYHFGASATNDVEKTGNYNESVDSLTVSRFFYSSNSNLTHAYTCTYDPSYAPSQVLSLIHSYQRNNLNYVNFTANASLADYILELSQKVAGSSLIIAYTKGTCSLIDNNMYLVESNQLPSKPFASFAFGTPKEIPFLIQVKYDRIALNGSDIFGSGSNNMCVSKDAITANNYPLVTVKRC